MSQLVLRSRGDKTVQGCQELTGCLQHARSGWTTMGTGRPLGAQKWACLLVSETAQHKGLALCGPLEAEANLLCSWLSHASWLFIAP